MSGPDSETPAPDNYWGEGYWRDKERRVGYSDPYIDNYKLAETLVLLEESGKHSISLIASENYPDPLAQKAASSRALSKNWEGYRSPGAGAPAFYAQDALVGDLHSAALHQARQLFQCSYANVQPLSGALANTAVMQALTKPGDTILAATFESGAGHFTQGGEKHLSRAERKVINFGVDSTGRIDYDDVEKQAMQCRPRIIVVGGSGYPRQYDFERLGKIAKKSGAKLWVDMAQIAGLVAAGIHPSPFPYADVVTSSTHKTLGGVRGGFILWNDDALTNPINDALFPGLQGEPDNGKIAAAAVIFNHARSNGYKRYQAQVVKNAQALADSLLKRDFKLVTDGTDNHMVVIDLRDRAIDGASAANALAAIGLYCNKMPIPGDKGGEYSGLRLGTPCGTKRGMDEGAFRKIGDIVVQALEALCQSHDHTLDDAVSKAFRKKVEAIARRYPEPESPFLNSLEERPAKGRRPKSEVNR